MSQSRLRLTPLVDKLPSTVPFVGPETAERASGQPFRARLGANENGFGPSPKAIVAMQAGATEIWKYCDPENHDLRHAIADHYGVGANNVVVGEGIDGLLGYLVRLFIGQGDAVVTSNGAYPTFNFHVAGFGGELHKVPFKGDHEDPDALIAKALEVDAKLVYIANPDNPMGTWHDAETLDRMIANLPAGAILILDEAYVEFAPEDGVPAIDITARNVIRMRTFSKAYGMAGARVGYALGHEELIGAFDKIRNHFGVNKIAQLGAEAALKDQAYLAELQDRVRASRARIGAIAAAHGMTTVPSATNFVAIDCGRDGDYARSILNALVARGIFVRMPFVAHQDRCIRISVGPEAELDAFEAAFAETLAELNPS